MKLFKIGAVKNLMDKYHIYLLITNKIQWVALWRITVLLLQSNPHGYDYTGPGPQQYARAKKRDKRRGGGKWKPGNC
jgi:hypothetical protein